MHPIRIQILGQFGAIFHGFSAVVGLVGINAITDTVFGQA